MNGEISENGEVGKSIMPLIDEYNGKADKRLQSH